MSYNNPDSRVLIRFDKIEIKNEDGEIRKIDTNAYDIKSEQFTEEQFSAIGKEINSDGTINQEKVFQIIEHLIKNEISQGSNVRFAATITDDEISQMNGIIYLIEHIEIIDNTKGNKMKKLLYQDKMDNFSSSDAEQRSSSHTNNYHHNYRGRGGGGYRGRGRGGGGYNSRGGGSYHSRPQNKYQE